MDHTLYYPTSIAGRPGLVCVAQMLASVGFVFCIRIRTIAAEGSENSSRSSWRTVAAVLRILVIGNLSVNTYLWLQQETRLNFHPIDGLIQDTKLHHDTYLVEALASHSLNEAIRNHQERYNRHPPPGLDSWYAYATERHSVDIDDYDNINRDLLPFFALSPQEI